MKPIVFLLLCEVFLITGAHVVDSYHAHRHEIILTRDDLIREAKKPGILYYHFRIPPTSNETLISLAALEDLARSAERKGCDLSVQIEIDGKKNISMLLDKCGMLSTTSNILIQNEIIVVSPNYFTSLTNVGLQNCEGVEKPMLLHIYGDHNTSGTLSVNELEYPNSVKVLMQDLAIRYTYPILLVLVVIIFGCSCPRSLCCSNEPVVVDNKRYRTWDVYPRRRICYGSRGVSV